MDPLRELTARLRDEVDLETLRRELTAIVAETRHPRQVSVWIRSDV
jgi:hypothetical protein